MWALLGALLAAALPRAAAQIGDAAFEPVGGVPVCEKPPEPVGTTVRVATPACLQAAIDTGAQHVIITSHMNLTNLPSLQDSIGTDAVLGSRPNTRSLRGDCMQASPFAHPDYPSTAGQCVLLVREDFLQLETALSNFWVHQLYVRIVGNAQGEHGHGTLFGSHSGNLYMTASSMVGDGGSARAVDVREGSSLYMRDCLLANLSKDKQTAVRVKKAARATFVRTRFEDNTAITGDVEKEPVGPAVGLENDQTNTSVPASAAWFQDCVFVNHTTTHKKGEQYNVPLHEVSVDDAKVQVFTNTPDSPMLWDRAEGELVPPVLVGPGETADGAFGPAVTFLTEDDDWFRMNSELNVGTGPFQRVLLPDATQLAVWPRPDEDDDDDDDAAVAGLAAATAVLGAIAIAATLLACLLWRRSRKAPPRSEHSELGSGKHARSSPGGTHGGFTGAPVHAPVQPPRPQGSIASSEPGFHQFPETDVSFDAKAGDRAAPGYWPGAQPAGPALDREFTESSADPSSARGGGNFSNGGVLTVDSWPGSLGAATAVHSGVSGSEHEVDHFGAPPRRAGLATPGAPMAAATDGAAAGQHAPFRGDTVAVAPTEPLTSDHFDGAAAAGGMYELPPPLATGHAASAHAQSYTPTTNGESLAPRTTSSGGDSDMRGLGTGKAPMAGVAPVAREPLPDVRRTQVLDKTQAAETDSAEVSHQKVQEMLNDVRAAGVPFESKYTLLGATEQRLAGAGVVQFATGPGSGPHGTAAFALKFFTRRAAYDRIAALAATPALAPTMWTLVDTYPNDWGRAHAGAVLPACVAMRRGEPLDAWARRLRPNLPTALNALVQIAELLRDLHAAGYAYRNLKPSNVAWMSDEGRWALIDFACTMPTGTRAPLSFSLNYAAPEVLLAAEAGDAPAPAAAAAADIWSLGVVAFELLLLRRTFSPGTPETEIRDRIAGRLPLPWEEVEPTGLRTLQPSVLQCLSRAPAARPTAESIVTAWRNLLDFAAVKHTEMGV